MSVFYRIVGEMKSVQLLRKDWVYLPEKPIYVFVITIYPLGQKGYYIGPKLFFWFIRIDTFSGHGQKTRRRVRFANAALLPDRQRASANRLTAPPFASPMADIRLSQLNRFSPHPPGPVDTALNPRLRNRCEAHSSPGRRCFSY
jgi:hypothetical protein